LHQEEFFLISLVSVDLSQKIWLDIGSNNLSMAWTTVTNKVSSIETLSQKIYWLMMITI
jgi:hypothetical protein